MSRDKNSGPTEAQRAVVELRKHLCMTQQQLAVHMGITVTTVARWERIREPRGPSLVQLMRVADEFKRPDLWKIFDRARYQEAALEYFPSPTCLIVAVHAVVGGYIYAAEHPAAGNRTVDLQPLRLARDKMMSAIIAAHAELQKVAEAGVTFPGAPLLSQEKLEDEREHMDKNE